MAEPSPSSRSSLIAALESQPAVTLPFADFLALLHSTRYTGPVTFHCFSGVPTSAELAHDPVSIRLDHRAPVDSRK